MNIDSYLITGSAYKQEKRVEAWCHDRLPYNKNTGWSTKFLPELRAKLAELDCHTGEVLHAIYESRKDVRRCDAENILFYNVGPRTFGHLAHSGLTLSESFLNPADRYTQ